MKRAIFNKEHKKIEAIEGQFNVIKKDSF